MIRRSASEYWSGFSTGGMGENNDYEWELLRMKSRAEGINPLTPTREKALRG